jgi:hypothetical protein
MNESLIGLMHYNFITKELFELVAYENGQPIWEKIA